MISIFQPVPKTKLQKVGSKAFRVANLIRHDTVEHVRIICELFGSILVASETSQGLLVAVCTIWIVTDIVRLAKDI